MAVNIKMRENQTNKGYWGEVENELNKRVKDFGLDDWNIVVRRITESEAKQAQGEEWISDTEEHPDLLRWNHEKKEFVMACSDDESLSPEMFATVLVDALDQVVNPDDDESFEDFLKSTGKTGLVETGDVASENG